MNSVSPPTIREALDRSAPHTLCPCWRQFRPNHCPLICPLFDADDDDGNDGDRDGYDVGDHPAYMAPTRPYFTGAHAQA